MCVCVHDLGESKKEPAMNNMIRIPRTIQWFHDLRLLQHDKKYKTTLKSWTDGKFHGDLFGGYPLLRQAHLVESG